MTGLAVGVALCADAAPDIPPAALEWGRQAIVSEMLDGQFNPLLDIHLVQYSLDREWTANWMASRYGRSGILGEYGSVTGEHLYTHTDILLNIPLNDRFRLRYDRRQWEEGRFEQRYERLEAQYFVLDRLALVLCGMPAFEKAEGALGGGLFAGTPGGTNYLSAVAVGDRFIHNDKTDSNLLFTREPVRFLVDGYYRAGDWRVYGSLNWVDPYEMTVSPGEGEPGVAQARSAWKHYGFLGVDRFLGTVVTGLRAEYSAEGLERDEGRGLGTAAEPVRTTREWVRGEGFVRHEGAAWTTEGFLGYAVQEDECDAGMLQNGAYAMDAILVGLGLGRRVSASSSAWVGYIGSLADMDRTRDGVSSGMPVADGWSVQGRRDYTDKVHVRWLYTFHPDLKMEILLSHELSTGSFGGGSFKAVFLF